ncbi:MAG TPA: hypothetical protein VG839_07045 [Asticcacaulis sp.]|nr:hypothetical protein [Asticcacaulis sp.]
MPNYFNELGLANADPTEVINLCLAFFGNGEFTNDRLAAFGRAQGRIALKISCNAIGNITNVEPGPDFLRSDLISLRSRIEEELLSSGPTQIARQILFNHARLDGFYRHTDQFQILPVPIDSPRPDFSCSDHPSILEVSFASSSNPFTSHARGTRTLNKTELMLIPLLPSISRLQVEVPDRTWTNGPSETSLWRQDYAQVGYMKPHGPPESFTDTTSCSPLPVMAYQKYYSSPAEHHNTFKVPDSLATSLSKVAKLSAENYQRYLRAAYWLKQSRLSGPFGNSPSFVALISVVEALMGPPVRTGTCDTCKQAISIGNTALFKNFIDQHTSPDTASNKLKNEFYNMRSEVAHGGCVFRSDLEGWGTSLRGSYEHHRFTTLYDLVRILIYNWLQRAG